MNHPSTSQHVDTASLLSRELHSRHSISASHRWLLKFLSTVKLPLPPLPSLVSTAHFRLLNTDVTQSLATSPLDVSPGTLLQPMVLPANIAEVDTKSTSLSNGVIVQVLTIVDIGTSRNTQIEALERVERGEEVRGREVIRSVPIMNELDQSTTTASGTNAAAVGGAKKSTGPHKLLVQDAAGTKVYAFESTPLPKLYITNSTEDGGTCIGCKLLLKRGCLVRRGLVMLNPDDTVVLGGKVEAWDVAWRKNRKERLMKELKDEYESTINDDGQAID